LDASNGSLHGSFRNKQMMASSTEEEEEEEEERSEYRNKPQTVVEALSFLLEQYDW